jgi:transcriptional regulator with XRE-family HTH domain
LAQLRRKKKLKQKQVAYEASMDPSYVAALENGRRAPPRQSMMANIGRALNANEQEVVELRRAAMLSEMARELNERAEYFVGAPVAMAILEMSSIMSPGEIQAIATLIDGYRFRSHAQGRTDM